MNVGKIPESVLKRSVLNKLKVERPEVIVHPGVGEDCAVFGLQEEEAVVLSTDPITGAAKDIGRLAFHITANDIASSGAELIGILLTIIMPPGTEEKELKEIMAQITECTEEYNVEVLGGHTEVSNIVNQTLISVTGVGKINRKDIVKTAGLETGDDIVVTKWAGMEGTAILAKEKEEELKEHFTMNFLEEASSLGKKLSIISEAGIAKRVGVTAMHDVTEGGIFGALWEMAAASDVGLEIHLKKIPIRQETIEICEVFDLNPYQLISSGCLLIGTKQGTRMVDELIKAGIDAAVIGRASEGNDRVVWCGDECRFLEPPKSDELYKVV